MLKWNLPETKYHFYFITDMIANILADYF